MPFFQEGAASRGSSSLDAVLVPIDWLKAAALMPFTDAMVVQRLTGYDETDLRDLKPRYGSRLGLYHPIFSRISLLEEEDWRLYDLLMKEAAGQDRIPTAWLRKQFVADYPSVQRRIEAFHQAGFVLATDEDWQVNLEPSFQEAELYVNITEGCNFSCPGCATASDVIPPTQARTLDPPTLRLYLISFLRSCAEKRLARATVKWAGGEPTLKHAFALVREGIETLRELASQYPVEVTHTLLTNGVFLDDEKIRFLRDAGCHVSVSLWGTEPFQDAVRKPRNHQETFAVVIERIRRLHELGLSYNVNHVVTPQNADGFSDFITMLWDTEHPDFLGKRWERRTPIPLGIQFFRPNNGSPFGDRAYPMMERGLRRGFARIFDLIERGIPIQSLERMDYLDLFSTIVTPCGSGFVYVAVGVDGVAPCHEGLYGLQSNKSRIERGENLFDIANEEYQSDRAKLFGPNIEFGDNTQRALALHGGQGCPRLVKAENNGRLGTCASTSHLYGHIFYELLCLEALRRIKQAPSPN